MKQFYVYELVDPRDQSVFYIGKGKGERFKAHEAEAKTGSNSAKCRRIREIISAGHVVGHRIVRWFKSEDAAYRYEKRVISSIGLENLTNIAPGGKWPAAWDKSKACQDRQVVFCFERWYRCTDGFQKPTKFRVFGQWWPIDIESVAKIKETFAEIYARRGKAFFRKAINEGRSKVGSQDVVGK